MSVSFIGSILFVKSLEYRLVKKRWVRLQEKVAPSNEIEMDVGIEDEITRLEEAASVAHLPDGDTVSSYYSALDMDLDSGAQ